MNKAGWIAIGLSILGIAAAYFVSYKYFENVPHVEDEMAYVFQAKIFVRGQMSAPSAPDQGEMTVPFVVNHNGQRFGKYPPGWPMLLGLGIALGVRSWVNPFLAGLAIWLTYRLGEKLLSRNIGLLAGLLTLLSPFFLMVSGSLDSDALTLVLTLAFILAWLDTLGISKKRLDSRARSIPAWLTMSVAGASLGLLFLTRPLTAVGVAVPFFIHGLVLLIRGNTQVRLRVLGVGALAAAVGSIYLLWQYRVTGSPFTNPYTLWWSFDKIGLGQGVGTSQGGYTLSMGINNAKDMLKEVEKDLFGWKAYSWLFLPFGIWAIRRNLPALMTLSIFASLVFCYLFYWAEVGNYGARYYYEGLPGLALTTSAGIAWLATRIRQIGWRQVNAAVVVAIVAGLVTYNLTTFMPARLNKIYGLYGIHRSQLTPFELPQVKAQAPALVFVHVTRTWTEYAGLLELEDPWLTSPFIFAWSTNPARDAALALSFPQRRVLQYFPDNPNPLEGLVK